MKYVDEYQYGIYPYVPEYVEKGESQPVFENEGDGPASRNVYENPDMTRQQPQNNYGISGIPSEPQITFEPETPEKLSPDAFDNWEMQNSYGDWNFREAGPKKPYGFWKTQRNAQPDMQPLRRSMPADPYPYKYPRNLDLALDLMQEALIGENEDKLFYAQLLRAAPTQEDRDIISGIRNDEMKHFELFRKLYYELTGQILPAPVSYENGTRMTYCEGLKKALLGEVAAVAKYRKILFAMQDRRHINILTEILTDEIRHADLYGLLFDISACHAKHGME